MNDISKIDKNFEVKTNIEKDNIKFYDAEDAPFSIHGVKRDVLFLRRMPYEAAMKVNAGVQGLSGNAAGGRVRFVTDSSYIAINCSTEPGKMPHFALTGSAGFDIYVDNSYAGTYMPPFDIQDGYESIIDLGCKKERSITINMPLYSSVKKLYVGIENDAFLKEHRPYRYQTPFVAYGSSITQGGCASRPGMSYLSIVSRKFDSDYINLGFSGSARGEDEMVRYINQLDMSLFIYDYDHNATFTSDLEKTHERFFLLFREAHPDTPVIMMNRPKRNLCDEEKKRREVIERTYNNALSRKDKNVYFVTNTALTELCKDEGTVDNVHPTDFGFASMAQAVCEQMEKIGFVPVK